MRKQKNLGRLSALLLAAAMASSLTAGPLTAFASQPDGSGKYVISQDNEDESLRHGPDCLQDVKSGGSIRPAGPSDPDWPQTDMGLGPDLIGHMDGVCYKTHVDSPSSMPSEDVGPGSAEGMPDDGGAHVPDHVYKPDVNFFMTGRPEQAAPDDGLDTAGESAWDTSNYGANVKFTVQYYAYLDVLDKSAENADGTLTALPVIDTSGRSMPVNGGAVDESPTDNDLMNLWVDSGGIVQTTNELLKLYESKSYEYYKAPTIHYFNRLVDNPNYEICQLWVAKPGTDPDSVDRDDWVVYDSMEYHPDTNSYTYADPQTDEIKPLHFTNREESSQKGTHIHIPDGAVLRLVYDQVGDTDGARADRRIDADFYDYDISNGVAYKHWDFVADMATKLELDPDSVGDKFTSPDMENVFPVSSIPDDSETWYCMYTNQSGINSDSNYADGGDLSGRFAFGNAPSHNGLLLAKLFDICGDETGYLINQVNPKSYGKLVFGLVDGLDDNGNLIWADGISAPDLFGEHGRDTIGRTDYTNGEYGLGFVQNGDTWTLSSVMDHGGTVLQDLDKFRLSYRQYVYGVPDEERPIKFSNMFWPMDSAPSFGTDGHDMKFGWSKTGKVRDFFGVVANGAWVSNPAPVSDGSPGSLNDAHHNSFFGMKYNVEFDLDADYAGPLEYIFFGDDDMWVFLDGQLVIDIGGIHTAVGEYVDLWDYLRDDNGNVKAGKHRLDFYYMERGASGSTCYMQFTLPSVTSGDIQAHESDYADLQVSKKVVGAGPENGVFRFSLRLTDQAGNALLDDYSYIVRDADGNDTSDYGLVLHNGSEFVLRDGYSVVVRFLPAGTKYDIIETDTQGAMDTGVTGGNYDKAHSRIASGRLARTGAPSYSNGMGLDKNQIGQVLFTNYYHFSDLPQTGGSGTGAMLAIGLAGIAVCYIVLLLARRRQDAV